mgnify:CR=1 FL=1
MSNFLNFAGNSGVTFKSFTASGGTTYTLDVSSSTNSLMVSIGGVLQKPVTDYTVSGTTLTTTDTIASGIVIDTYVIHNAGGTTPIIEDNSVTTAKILNNNVTGAKIAMGSDAAGDILYYNGTDYVRLGKGTTGHFLSQGGSNAPAWAAAGGGGTAVIARATFSTQTAVPITGFDSSKYDAYKIYWEMTPSTDGADLRYRTSTDGGSSYDSGSSDYRWRHIINDGSSPPVDFTVDGPEGRSTRGASNGGYLLSAGTGEHAVGEVTIIAPDNTGYTQIIADNLGFHTNGIVQYSKLYFARLSAADVDAIQLSPSAGNITGRYVFMGINNSVT